MNCCRKEAGGNVLFTGGLAHDNPLLASAYAAARLFVLPSYSEVMPLTLYEAAAAGCRVIVSKNVPVASLTVNLIPTFDPCSPSDLRSLIASEMEKPRNSQLQAAVRDMASWRCVCEQIASIYEKVLSSPAVV